MRSTIACKVWSAADFQLLQRAVEKHGKAWDLISERYFPNRKPNCIKCKYNYYLRTLGKTPSIRINLQTDFKGYQEQMAQQVNALKAKLLEMTDPPTDLPLKRPKASAVVSDSVSMAVEEPREQTEVKTEPSHVPVKVPGPQLDCPWENAGDDGSCPVFFLDYLEE